MRILVLGLAAILPAASAAAPAPSTQPAEQRVVLRTPVITTLPVGQKCRRPNMHEAQRPGPTEFKRLDELPPATAYMAVYRTVDGCEIPMTVTEYRTGRR